MGAEFSGYDAAERFRSLAAGLAGLSGAELLGAKRLYIRDAISELRAFEAHVRAIRPVRLLFAIVPFFWPFLYAQSRSIEARRQLLRERILNAMEVWREELRDDRIEPPWETRPT